jgi:hypothetical protein
MEVTAWRGSRTDCIGSHSLFFSREVEQQRLHEALNTAFAARGRVVGGVPVEQPFIRSSIKQSQLRRTKWRLHQARVAHLLNMLAI